MTLRYDRDRQAISERAAATFGWLCTAGHTVSHLRAKIDLEIEDGLKGTAYDGDNRGGGDGTSHPERQAINERSDRACEALSDLDRGLELIAQGEALVHGVVNAFDPPTKRKPGDTDDKRKPGKGKAPAHRCATCWLYGSEEMTDERYRHFCRWCGDWQAAHDERPHRALWNIHRTGKRVTTADLRKHARHLLPTEQAS